MYGMQLYNTYVLIYIHKSTYVYIHLCYRNRIPHTRHNVKAKNYQNLTVVCATSTFQSTCTTQSVLQWFFCHGHTKPIHKLLYVNFSIILNTCDENITHRLLCCRFTHKIYFYFFSKILCVPKSVRISIARINITYCVEGTLSYMKCVMMVANEERTW